LQQDWNGGMMNKSDVLEMFEEIQEVMLATTDGEKAYVRPVMMVYNQERFFIATGSVDAKCDQIRKVGSAEVCYYPDSQEKGCYVRINGKADLISDIKLKGEIMEVASYIKHYWTDPADQGYAVIELLPEYFAYLPYGSNIEKKILS
jgi:uncharacterized pyridoxamine 5'-phosphate oxidase family protein